MSASIYVAKVIRRALPRVASHDSFRFFKATFLHPEKLISEELTSGEEVFVDLLSKM